MQRSRKMVIVSHCILNTNAKVESETTHTSMIKELIDILYEKDLGIIQLPCPEMMHCGMKRWGHVKDQFDNPFFRQNCQNLLFPIVQQIQEYMKCGYEVAAILGIDYSPSCGVNITCSSTSYLGELSLASSLEELEASIKKEFSMGVFMEEFKLKLKAYNINIPFIGIDEVDMEKSLQEVKLL